MQPIVRNEDKQQIFTGELYHLEGVLKDRTPTNGTEIQFETLHFKETKNAKQEIIAPDKFPVSTSCEFRLNAEYDIIILDKNEESGYKTVYKKYSKSFSNIGNNGSLVLNNTEDDKDSKQFLAEMKFIHSFNDTKYHKVKYQIEAISRFKEYFPKETDFSVFGKFMGSNQKEIEFKVKNSQKPDALQIDTIVPLFTWSKESGSNTRLQNKWRVYFKDDFYSSGADEKVAVLFIDRNNETIKDEEDKATIPDDCEGLVSEFGTDPTVYEDLRTRGISDSFFVGTNKDYPVVGTKSVENDIIDIRLLQRGEQKFSTPLSSPQKEYFVKAALYDIFWDKCSDRFYCEIAVDSDCIEKRYFPFLKFALSRFQQNSIKDIQLTSGTSKVEKSNYDYRFSNVMMTPQVQSLPLRTIKLEDGIFYLETGNVVKTDSSKNRNEFWLIGEPKNDNNFATLVDKSESKTSVFQISNIAEKKGQGKIKIIDDHDLKKYKTAYIEEFEYYEVNFENEFKMEIIQPQIIGAIEYYNPRNDIRKRLVFTYKLKD